MDVAPDARVPDMHEALDVGVVHGIASGNLKLAGITAEDTMLSIDPEVVLSLLSMRL